jgi:hypothetical protein
MPAFWNTWRATTSGRRPAARCASSPTGAPCVGDVDRLDPVLARLLEPLGDEVDADHPRALVPGDPPGHLPDRPEPEDRDRPALRDRRVLDRLPRRRQDVGEEDEALVRRPLRDLDRAEMGHRDAQVLGLAARDLAVEFRIAEQRGARSLIAILGRLTLRVEPLPAHPAASAGDVERDHHAVAGLDLLDLGAHVLDDPHRLVTEDVTGLEERPEDLV